MLNLIGASSPSELPAIVRNVWALERSTAFHRHALELLYVVDRESALSIMLEEGLRTKNAGTRVAVCGMLGAEGSEKVTGRLLKVLRDDHSKWVRLRPTKPSLARVDKSRSRKYSRHQEPSRTWMCLLCERNFSGCSQPRTRCPQPRCHGTPGFGGNGERRARDHHPQNDHTQG